MISMSVMLSHCSGSLGGCEPVVNGFLYQTKERRNVAVHALNVALKAGKEHGCLAALCELSIW